MQNKLFIRSHTFHIVDPSPWPFLISLLVGIPLPIGAVMFMHEQMFGFYLLVVNFFVLILFLSLWWYDVITEGTFQGKHTRLVQDGLRLGFVLFIISEVMFFVSFFWAFFHSSLAPAVQIGSIWPPLGIAVFDPFGIPLANTFILLTSGMTITAAHHNILNSESESKTIHAVIVTIILAVAFTCFQIFEYMESEFVISDGIYSSIFFIATGFHGFHVLVGTIFLIVTLFRLIRGHFSTSHHIGFEASAWYWHFVDVVWLFLFVVVYWWGGYVYH